MRGLSPLISVMILIAIIITIGVIVSPWATNLAQDITNKTAFDVEEQLRCQNAAYDFDTSYGDNGIKYNFSGANDTLEAKIVNTGAADIHNFSFEFTVNTTGGFIVKNFNANITTQRTKSNPLQPSRSAIIAANVTENLDDDLRTVKVLNEACQRISVSQDI